MRSLRASDGSPLSLLGIGVLAAIVITLAWVVIFALPLLRRPAPQAATAQTPGSTQGSKLSQADQIEQFISQIEGRSLFFIPTRPAIDDHGGPAATSYEGPALIAMINDTAWFADGDRVSLQSPQGKSVRLVRLNPPWGARVEWEGGEFDVDLFKRVPVSSLRDSLGKPSPASSAPAPLPNSPVPGGPAAAAADGPPQIPPGTRLADPTKSTSPAPPPSSADEPEEPQEEPHADPPPSPQSRIRFPNPIPERS